MVDTDVIATLKTARKLVGSMSAKHVIQVRRAYDEPTPADGARVLVDRIWPRGLSKGKG